VTRKTVEQLLAEARAGVRRLGPAEARDAAARGALLVDVRAPDDRLAEGAIPGALHLPLSVLEWRADPASDTYNAHVGGLERELVVVCNDGYSSSLAAARLRELGFAGATDLVGGFRAWRAEGLPVVAAPQPPAGLPGSGEPD
jgi:rhodanese-related sulfurtransferase